MRQRTTAELRLDQGKATSFGAAEAGNATIRVPTDRLRSNFVAARLDQPDSHAQRPGNRGDVGLRPWLAGEFEKGARSKGTPAPARFVADSPLEQAGFELYVPPPHSPADRRLGPTSPSDPAEAL